MRLANCSGDHVPQMGQLGNLIISLPAVCVADDVLPLRAKIYI